MSDTSLVKRVEILEQHVESLKDLPSRMAAVEGQILQLRDELRDGFSALREKVGELRLELQAFKFETLGRFEAQDKRFEAQDKRFEAQDKRFDAQDKRFDAQDKRFDAHGDRFDDLKRYMLMLHENVLERIALLGEGRSRLPPKESSDDR